MSIFSKEAKGSKELLKAEHPDIYNEVYALGEASGQENINALKAEEFEKGRDQGTAEGEKIGAKAELARVLAVQAQSQPGHEELIAKMVADGKSTPGEAAQAVIAAQKEKLAAGLKALKDDAPDPVEPDETEGNQTPSSDPIKAAWDGKDGAAFKAEFGGDYASYENYFKNDEKYIATGKISLPA